MIPRDFDDDDRERSPMHPEPPQHPPIHADDSYIDVDAADLPTAVEAYSEFEAEAIRAVLSDSGIRSVTVPSGSSVFGFPMRAEGGGIPVKVLPDDLSRAREVLSRARFVGRSVDWDDVDVGEMPPEVRSTLERGRMPRTAGGAVVAFGAVVAIGIALLALGGLVMWIVQLVRSSSAAVAALAAPVAGAALLLGAAGCTYTLQGRAVEGFGAVEVTDVNNGEANQHPVPGVRIELIRDSTNTNRARVATAVSGKDGSFALEVDAFGAGWMEEEWLIRASRSGYQNVETLTSLPASAKGHLLLVSLVRGKGVPFQEPETAGSLMDEARKYDSGVGRSPH